MPEAGARDANEREKAAGMARGGQCVRMREAERGEKVGEIVLHSAALTEGEVDLLLEVFRSMGRGPKGY